MKTTYLPFLVFVAVTAAVAVCSHVFVRRYWRAIGGAAVAASIINVMHEGFSHGLQVRPADVAFWIPMLFLEGVILALPIAAIVGIPFYVFRRRKHPHQG